MTNPRTITRVPLKGGGWAKLDWPKLAHTTAQVLEFVPKSPPFNGKDLLDTQINSEDQFPHLDLALQCLNSILNDLEGYARTGTVDVMDRDGQALVSAMAGLDLICKKRWGLPHLHRDIPIEIASIARSISLANSKSAKQPRGTRSNFLKDEKRRVLKSDPEFYWHEILDQLQGDSVVISYDQSNIRWLNEDGETKITKVSTFQKY